MTTDQPITPRGALLLAFADYLIEHASLPSSVYAQLARECAEYLPDAATILWEIAEERSRQNAKWGEQNHPDGTGPDVHWLNGPRNQQWPAPVEASGQALAEYFRNRCKANSPDDDNYLDILMEEVAEAFAENDPARLRTELIQVAAVATQWVETIDRRTGAR